VNPEMAQKYLQFIAKNQAVQYIKWDGVKKKQQADGSIGGSTTGVSSSTSPTYYLNYPRIADSDHLLGPLFLAGAEMIKLYRSYNKPVPGGWDLGTE
jgi:hypothetical protein